MKIYDEVDYWSNNTKLNNKKNKLTSAHGKYIEARLDGNKHILELGPGKGRLLKYYQNVNSICAYDISDLYKKELLKEAGKYSFSFELIIKKEVGVKLPFTDNQFDASVSSEVFLHQRPKNIVFIMKELARVSKNKVIVVTYMDLDKDFSIKSELLTVNNANSFNHNYKQICKNNSLKILDYKYDNLNKQLYFEYTND